MHLDFHECGPDFAVMLQPMTDVVAPKPGAAQVVRAVPPLPDTRAPALRRLLLQARALQIACALRAHCHPMPPRVEIGSRHECLPAESVTLALAASGWDLELPARLQELEVLFDRKEVGPDFGTFCAAEGIRVTLQGRPAPPDREMFLDWLAGPRDPRARPLRPLLSEGPRSVLVLTGRSLALNGALRRSELRALAPQLLAAPERPADPDALADALSAGLPDPLRLRAPDVPLRLRYGSLSGACERAERPRLHDGTPVPDARRSMRLLRLVRDCAQNTR